MWPRRDTSSDSRCARTCGGSGQGDHNLGRRQAPEFVTIVYLQGETPVFAGMS